jgi:hypothetical protein
MRMTEAAHGDAAQGIEIFFPLGIPQPSARTALEGHGQGGEYRHLVRLGRHSSSPKT